MQHQQDYVLRTVEERRVRLVRLWFTDVLGQLKSVAISPVELEAAFSEGVQFDGSAIDGFSRMQESDVLARPDPNSFQLMPTDDGEVTARVFCDIANLDGSPFEGDPRQVLRRNLAAAADAGFEFMCAPEVEFFYFEGAERGTTPVPLDEASYFDLTANDSKGHIRRRTIQRLEATGIPVEYSFHEDAPSQHEIDLRYSDALTMADNVMALRMIVREVAMSEGIYATFMPKPMEGVQGSGMHTHMSLWSADANAFHDPESADGLSDVARSFIAGVLAHANETTAVTNQLVNSYKRLVAGFEAPVNISWAHNDRTALVRVPVPKRNKEARGTRIEYRALDPACNPYLAFSVVLAAGLQGVARGYELGEESVAALHEEAARSHSTGLLPANLSEALDAMESSALVRDTLGEHIFEWFLRNKRAEWAAYRTHVSSFELERYLRTW
ncbi:MAG: glutamine synthetase family protein [Microthrixaceae bacterium]|nr:glutamine synthetase [Microthrixaceae bacterium]MCO5318617.1 glutamine synthetase family protein [Microthrixaceae bacterium]